MTSNQVQTGTSDTAVGSGSADAGSAIGTGTPSDSSGSASASSPTSDPDEPEQTSNASTSEVSTSADSSLADEPPVFTIGSEPPAPQGQLAPGVVVGQQIVGETPGTASYVIMTVDADLSVTENWRFDILTATAGDDPAYGFDALAHSSFTSDFTKLAGTASYALSVGSDSHIGYFTADGSFTDLSGRTDAQKGANQTRPVFGPDDRLYYWQFQSQQPSYLLMSVKTDGSDRRAETQWQDLVPAGQEFHFGPGAAAIPVYDQKPEVVVSDDNSVAVTSQYGKAKVGNALELADAPEFSLSGVTDFDAVGFLPGSVDNFIGFNGSEIVAATIDPGSQAIDAQLLPDLDDFHVRGTPQTVTVVDADTVGFALVNEVTAGQGHTDVSRIVLRQIASADFRYANIAQADNQQGSPVILGVVAD